MKNILITGASKGIGFETALNLAECGHQVIATARSSEELKVLTSENQNISIVAADLTSDKDLSALVNKVDETAGVDILINNAGMLVNKPFIDTSDSDWEKVFGVNFFAPVRLIKKIKPYLNQGSHIVNIGSMGGYQGSDKFPGLSAYSAAKGALAILTESLSTEFSSDRISVNCLCLGAVQTKMLEQAFPGYEAPVSAQEMGEFISQFSLTAHKYMNGKIIPVSLNNPE